MKSSPRLRVVFSSTPYRIGSLIRRVTGCPYNHVSICPDIEAGTLYAFSRHYRNVPFYGGFVEESPLRLENAGRNGSVRFYDLPVTETEHSAVCRRIDAMRRDPDRWIYNLASAAAVPLGRRAPVRDAYTCAEFAASLLALCADSGLQTGRFYTIEAMMDALAPHLTYEGPVPDGGMNGYWNGDTFPRRQSTEARIALTLRGILRLVGRAAGQTHAFRKKSDPPAPQNGARRK